MSPRFVGHTLNPLNADLDARVAAINAAAVASLAGTRRIATGKLGNADVALDPAVDKPFQLASVVLTAQRVITLGAVTAADVGKAFHIARPAAGGFNYVVKDANAMQLATIPANGWGAFVVDETGAWRLARKGTIDYTDLVPRNGLQLWLEADYGIGVADGGLITNSGDWQDRSVNALHPVKGTGMTAPNYRANVGGSGLPGIEFANAHGLMTPDSPALSFTSFAVFMVGIRGNTDNDGNWYEMFVGGGIRAGFRDRAFGIYVSRDVPLFQQSAKEKNNPATTWMPRNLRKLFRHEYQGTHVSHKLYMNGVDQGLINSVSAGFAQDPGLQPSGNGSFHMGYRDVGTPGLNFTGHIMATLAYSPYPSAQDIASVAAYLARWNLQ